MDISSLKSKVLGKFFTITAFAEAIGWSRNKASRIVSGSQEPTLDDVVSITTVLCLNEEEFFNIFFAALSTLCIN